jgi:flagellar biosynthesis protein FlhG
MPGSVNIQTEQQNIDARPRRQTRIIAVTSGKGGVGKTNVASNLAIALAQQGARVCVFDADTSLANINIVMGLSAQYTIEHLLNGDRTIDDILITGPAGISIVPSASGISKCAHLDEGQRQRLIATLAELEARFDYLIIDTAAGIGREVIDFVRSAQYILLVITTEPTSLTDTFGLIRTLRREGCELPLYAVVCQARDYPDSWKVFARFQGAVRKFLRTDVRYLGYVGDDPHLKEAVGLQQPVVLYQPMTHASRCFRILANVVQKQVSGNSEHNSSFSEYWRTLSAVEAPIDAVAADTDDGDAESESRADDGGDTVGTGPADTIGSQQLCDWVTDQRLTQEQISDELNTLIGHYVKRFRRLPYDPQHYLKWLVEDSQYSRDDTRRLLQDAETAFVDRYQQPVNDLETTLVQLLLSLGMPTDLATTLKDKLSRPIGHRT